MSKDEARRLRYELRVERKQLIEKPDDTVIVSVFGGDLDRYRRCVDANFGDGTHKRSKVAA